MILYLCGFVSWVPTITKSVVKKIVIHYNFYFLYKRILSLNVTKFLLYRYIANISLLLNKFYNLIQIKNFSLILTQDGI